MMERIEPFAGGLKKTRILNYLLLPQPANKTLHPACF
jgi:hypothetical protein